MEEKEKQTQGIRWLQPVLPTGIFSMPDFINVAFLKMIWGILKFIKQSHKSGITIRPELWHFVITKTWQHWLPGFSDNKMPKFWTNCNARFMTLFNKFQNPPNHFQKCHIYEIWH